MWSIILLFIILSSFVTNGASYMIWSTKANGREFCEHVSLPDSVGYQQWFNGICDVASYNTEYLDHIRLTNLFIVRPIATHCMDQSVNMYVETHHDSDMVRSSIQDYIMYLKEITEEDYILHYIVQDVGKPFVYRDSPHLRYIIRNQLVCQSGSEDIEERHRPLTLEERNVLMHIAHHNHILINDVWRLQGRIQIMLLLPLSAQHIDMQNFLQSAQNIMNTPIEIVF